MNKLYIAIVLLSVFACKKDDNVVVKKVPQIYVREAKSVLIDSSDVLKSNDPTLIAFYRLHGFGTVWIASKERKILLNLLEKAGEEGLMKEDYNVAKINENEKKASSFSDKEMVAYDLLLTQSAQKYLWHLSNGKLNPKKLYDDWDLSLNKIDINKLLSCGIQGDSIAEIMELAKPKHYVYKSLRRALQSIDNFPGDTLKTIVFRSKIVKNDSNASIVQIKQRLIYWKDLAKTDSLTNIYDKATVKAMKHFQTRHGLAADGIIGNGTIDALNFTRLKRKQQIIANLERWRWFPREFGNHYIIINIPGFHLRIIKDNDTIERKRIVVGKIARKTPILSATFSNIVFNPTWTIPPTILREDVLPAASANRSYFAAREITIYDWKGNLIDPLDWNPVKFKSYRYVQAPGNNNSLGNVKFNFPNHYLVYLHDTNHRDFFGRHYRSLSSGCVRVENPLELAKYMLNDSIRWTDEKVSELIATKVTTSINLPKKIRLYQLYWTAWMERNGELQFRDDIYNLDEALYKKLRD